MWTWQDAFRDMSIWYVDTHKFERICGLQKYRLLTLDPGCFSPVRTELHLCVKHGFSPHGASPQQTSRIRWCSKKVENLCLVSCWMCFLEPITPEVKQTSDRNFIAAPLVWTLTVVKVLKNLSPSHWAIQGFKTSVRFIKIHFSMTVIDTDVFSPYLLQQIKQNKPADIKLSCHSS